MRRMFLARLALGCLGIALCGTLGGMGLASYAESGSFHFYRQARVAAWEPRLPIQPTAVQSADPAFASDRRDGGTAAVPEGEVASLYP